MTSPCFLSLQWVHCSPHSKSVSFSSRDRTVTEHHSAQWQNTCFVIMPNIKGGTENYGWRVQKWLKSPLAFPLPAKEERLEVQRLGSPLFLLCHTRSSKKTELSNYPLFLRTAHQSYNSSTKRVAWSQPKMVIWFTSVYNSYHCLEGV